MPRYEHFLKLLVLLGFIILGMLVTTALSGLVLVLSGMSLAEVTALSETGINYLPTGLIRALLAIQHVFIFIIPCLAFALVTYKSEIWRGLDLSRFPTGKLSLFGVLFLFAAYPIVNLSYLLNEAISLPLWTGELEDQAKETMKAILEMNSPAVFLINLLLIAILPGIGEELLFRGLVQKYLGKWFNNPIAAIWVSAILFSSIHMQFEGFFPRLVLGAILGYLYYWTKNLWVPIITHAFNNGIQVALIYSMGMELDAFEEQGSAQLDWWMIVLSIGAMYLLYRLIIKHSTVIE